MHKQQPLIIKDVRASIGDTEIVKGISLIVNPGEVHIIMGTNGSGKSSFVNALMGHPKFTKVSGELHLGGEELLHAEPNVKARRGLFLSPQYLPTVDGITLAYFLHQVNKVLSDEKKTIMDFYNDAVAKVRAIGIPESLLDRPLHAGLSGGEKKQSEIVSLLVIRPAFALLDEIDSGVDLDALKKIWKGVQELRDEGTGFVLITHYPAILETITPDAVHLIADGRIILSGGAELVSRIEQEGFETIITSL